MASLVFYDGPAKAAPEGAALDNQMGVWLFQRQVVLLKMVVQAGSNRVILMINIDGA
jgi:hypothetical protein